jgi:hypothetical protein
MGRKQPKRNRNAGDKQREDEDGDEGEHVNNERGISSYHSDGKSRDRRNYRNMIICILRPLFFLLIISASKLHSRERLAERSALEQRSARRYR